MPNFTLFSGKGEQSTLEHVDRFIVQCGHIGNNENMRQRLFPNSLIGIAFTWYTNLPANSVYNWQEMEETFHSQFYRIEPEVSEADLSRLHQYSNEPVEDYIRCFRKLKFQCKVLIPEIEFVKMATGGMNFELRNSFEGMEFRDLYELATMATRFEKILLDEQE